MTPATVADIAATGYPPLSITASVIERHRVDAVSPILTGAITWDYGVWFYRSVTFGLYAVRQAEGGGVGGGVANSKCKQNHNQVLHVGSSL